MCCVYLPTVADLVYCECIHDMSITVGSLGGHTRELSGEHRIPTSTRCLVSGIRHLVIRTSF